MLSRQEIELLRANIDKLSALEQQEVLEAIEELERREHIKRCQDDFLEFCLHMDPDYKVGAHHRQLATLLMQMEEGAKDRVAVSVPPRHGKSMMVSTLFPAWYMGKRPTEQIMLISHTADLAVDFGRKVRNIISSTKYGEIFPNVSLSADSKSAGRWNTNHGGQFYATGVGSALAGRGAHLCVSPKTIVCTKERGFIPAWSVREGEHLHSHHGYAKVQRVMITAGDAEVLIDGAGLSDTHPVWVYGKGWTPAADVDVDDLLWTTSIYDKVRSSLTRGVYYGATKAREVLQQGLQYLGHDVAKVHEPESSKLHILRRGWCKSLRAVARVLEFLRRHGGPTITKAYTGPAGRDRGLYPGELPVGRRVPPGQQPAQCSASYGAGENPVGSSVGTRDRYTARRYLSQGDCYGYDWRRSAGHSEDESQQKTDTPAQYGWLRTRVARWIGRSSEVARVRGQSRGDQEKRLVCKIQACELAASRTLGLLVGVRRVRSVVKRPHPVGVFVNFQVGGDNTFIVDNTILTHNCIIDDPHNEQDILNGNYSVFEKAYEWFTFGARTRLMRGGRIAVVHCLTGDTKVLMADGVEKPIRDVRPGDMVASYDNNSVVQARVLNWANQGLDRIYSIRMDSGVIIRGNGKHPLLVDDNGEHKWATIKTLKPGMQLVSIQGAPTRRETSCPVLSVKAATTKSCYRTKRGGLLKNLLSTLCTSALRKAARNHQKTRQNQITVRHVTPESGTTQRTPTPPGCHSGTTVNGKVRYVQLRVVNLLYMLRGCAARVWIKRSTDYVKKQVQLTARKGAAIRTSKLGMVLQGPNTTACLPSKQGSVRYVANHPMKGILPRNGVREGLQLIIATLLGKLGHFCATHVTSLSKTATLSSYLKQPLNTLSTTTQTIIEITHDGYEDVFDIQVEGTETFIANGVVSHNTRWHPSDLIGKLAKDMATKDGVDQYEFFEFPAILNENTDNEKALWPEFFNLEALYRTRASMPLFQWNAQYQQNPTGEAGAIVKRESWRRWEGEQPPECEYIIMALDAAAEKTNRADFTAMTVWGVFTHDVFTQGASHIILLHATNERLEFPDLKRLAFERYSHWQPDCFIVERKSSGIPLYQELRRAGVPVQEFTPSRASGDKIMRLNAVADIFRSGMVWYPVGKRWAEEVVEQVAAFPEVEHDDLTDTVSMALARFRAGGFIRLPSDYEDEPVVRMPRYAGYY